MQHKTDAKDFPSGSRTGREAGLLMKTIFKRTTGRIIGALTWPARMIAKLKHAMDVPIGYEDETGFHIGSEPVLQKIKSITPPCPSTFPRGRRDKMKHRSPFH
jgi:hypothetical protein